MERRYRVKPVKHKHQKSCKVAPSMEEPVLTRKLSGKLKMQEDILAKAPVLTSYGRYRLCIENYRSILEYREEQIRIQTKTGKISVQGRNLGIAYYRDECMCIIGEISSIQYIQE
ncbi:MAG: YabP/YqfC family sporulation protein [Lachnospiraceae bacterium]|nr:YabP/YqfC family sporulation protein [Lachnospiraceae bacterium]